MKFEIPASFRENILSKDEIRRRIAALRSDPSKNFGTSVLSRMIGVTIHALAVVLKPDASMSNEMQARLSKVLLEIERGEWEVRKSSDSAFKGAYRIETPATVVKPSLGIKLKPDGSLGVRVQPRVIGPQSMPTFTKLFPKKESRS